MEKAVRDIVGDRSNVTITVVKGKELTELGMNLFYAVGKGANVDPRCVVVNYKGNPASDIIDIAFVGKGITFDTGGLNIKPTGGMEPMFLDKHGACSVVGALHGTLELGLKKNIVFAMGFAENAVDANSYIPSDIITSMKGLTVQIDNTDAEGRLVLADTLTYVQTNYKPLKIVDLATLTGAIRIALGNETAGLFTNDEDFGQEIRKAGLEFFEKSWHMPITEESRANVIGAYSDLSNMGKSSLGGAIKAAAFLERFIEKDVKWVHLDIAGSAHHLAPKSPICSDGNGFGVSLLLNYLHKTQAQ